MYILYKTEVSFLQNILTVCSNKSCCHHQGFSFSTVFTPVVPCTVCEHKHIVVRLALQIILPLPESILKVPYVHLYCCPCCVGLDFAAFPWLTCCALLLYMNNTLDKVREFLVMAVLV